MSSRRISSANSRSESASNIRKASMSKEQSIQVYLNHRTRRPGGYDLNSSKLNTSTYTVKHPDSSFVSNRISVNSNSSITSSDISSPSSKPSSMHKSILLMMNNHPRPVNVLQTLYSPTKPEESKYQCITTPSKTVIVKSPKKSISEFNTSINESECFYSPTKTQCEIRNTTSSKTEIQQPGNSFVSYITQTKNRVTKTRPKLANDSNIKSTRSSSKARKSFRKSSAASNAPSISIYADTENVQNYSAIPSGSPVHYYQYDLMQNYSFASENSTDVSPIQRRKSGNRRQSFTDSILTQNDPPQIHEPIVNEKLKSMLADVMAEEEVSDDDKIIENDKKLKENLTKSPELTQSDRERVPSRLPTIGVSLSLDNFNPQVGSDDASLSSLQNDDNSDSATFEYYEEEEGAIKSPHSQKILEDDSFSEYKKASDMEDSHQQDGLEENLSEIAKQKVRPSNANIEGLTTDEEEKKEESVSQIINSDNAEISDIKNIEQDKYDVNKSNEEQKEVINSSDMAHKIIDQILQDENSSIANQKSPKNSKGEDDLPIIVATEVKDLGEDKSELVLEEDNNDQEKIYKINQEEEDKFQFEEDNIESLDPNTLKFQFEEEENYSDVESSLCNHNPSILDVNELADPNQQSPRMIDADDLIVEEESFPSEKDELNKCQVVNIPASVSPECEETSEIPPPDSKTDEVDEIGKIDEILTSLIEEEDLDELFASKGPSKLTSDILYTENTKKDQNNDTPPVNEDQKTELTINTSILNNNTNNNETEEENTKVNASDINSDDLFNLADSISEEDVDSIKIECSSPKEDELLDKGSDEEDGSPKHIYIRKSKYSINVDSDDEEEECYEFINEDELIVENDYVEEEEEDSDSIIHPTERVDRELTVEQKSKIVEDYVGKINNSASVVNELIKVADKLTLDQLNSLC